MTHAINGFMTRLMPHEKVLGSSRQSYRARDSAAMVVIQNKGVTFSFLLVRR